MSEIDLPESLRKYTFDKYFEILSEKNVENAEQIAKDIELGTYDYALIKGDDNQKYVLNYYKQIFIKMLGNLKFNKNSEYVIEQIKLGEFDFITLPSYPREILFPKKWDTIHKKTKDETKNIVIRRKGAYRCSRCKSWFTSHVEVQTRGADESATIKCKCNDCGHNWKFG